jgi:RNA polymerase sigma-70 factor (ECF subfamily)
LNPFAANGDSCQDEAMEFDNNKYLILLKKISVGDEAAFTELYKDMSRKVYAFALNRLHDPAQAEEIVVDTLHEVWKFPDRFRGESKFSTWLLGIARYKILNSYRSAEPDHDDLQDFEQTLVSADPDGYALLADKQRQNGVQDCMQKLSDEHRDCLHLVFYEGYTLGEVAEVQNVPENTVKTRLFHARQKVKNCLRNYLSREG